MAARCASRYRRLVSSSMNERHASGVRDDRNRRRAWRLHRIFVPSLPSRVLVTRLSGRLPSRPGVLRGAQPFRRAARPRLRPASSKGGISPSRRREAVTTRQLGPRRAKRAEAFEIGYQCGKPGLRASTSFRSAANDSAAAVFCVCEFLRELREGEMVVLVRPLPLLNR